MALIVPNDLPRVEKSEIPLKLAEKVDLRADLPPIFCNKNGKFPERKVWEEPN
jgi:hypothetical protein